MVSVASRKVSRAPRYSGIGFEFSSFSPTWLSHSMAPLSRGLRLTTELVTLLLPTLQLLLLARLLPHPRSQSCHLKDSLETLKLETMKLPLRTPAGISGTHKNLRSPCKLPNLFSCQISSSLALPA